MGMDNYNSFQSNFAVLLVLVFGQQLLYLNAKHESAVEMICALEGIKMYGGLPGWWLSTEIRTLSLLHKNSKSLSNEFLLTFDKHNQVYFTLYQVPTFFFLRRVENSLEIMEVRDKCVVNLHCVLCI